MTLCSIWAIVICTVFSYRFAVDCAIIQGPLNTAVVQGANVSFSCRSSSSTRKIYWDYYKLGKGNPKTVWNGIATDPSLERQGFRVDATFCKQESSCDALITNVSRESSGTIVCFESGMNTGPAASLSILETETHCQVNVSSSQTSKGTRTVYVKENATFAISCAVNYSGTWIPVIRCNVNSTFARYSYTSDTAFYSDVIPVTASLNNQEIECVTSFDDKVRHTSELTKFSYVGNVPDLKFSWKSPDFVVTERERGVSSTESTLETVEDNKMLALVTPGHRPVGAEATGEPNTTSQALNYIVVILVSLLTVCVIIIFKLRSTAVQKQGERLVEVLTLPLQSTESQPSQLQRDSCDPVYTEVPDDVSPSNGEYQLPIDYGNTAVHASFAILHGGRNDGRYGHSKLPQSLSLPQEDCCKKGTVEFVPVMSAVN